MMFLLIIGLCSCSSNKGDKFIEDVQSNQKEKPSAGGELKLPIIKFQTLNPIINDSKDVYYLNQLIYDGLVKIDKHYQVQPALAKNWEWLDSEKQWVIDLRQDVKWHDGTSFSAKDVKFTIDTLKLNLGKFNESIYGGYVKYIKRVEVINDYKLAVELDSSDHSFIEAFTFPIIPQHKFKNSQDVYKKEKLIPCGTGIYKIRQYDKNRFIELVPNKDFWGKQPYIASIRFEYVPDENVSLTLLEANEVSGAQANTFDWEKYSENESLKIHEYVTQDYEFLGFNFKHPLLQDKNIRKALAYGIDRHEIIEKVYLGHATLTDVPICPDSWLYDEEQKKYGKNLSKSKELLSASGFQNKDNDEWLENESNKELKFNLLVNEENIQRVQAAEMISNQLEEVGININIDKVSESEYKRRILVGKFDIVLAGWQFSDFFDLKFAFHSSYQDSTNFIGYQNLKMDRMLEEASAPTILSSKKEIYRNIQKLFVEDLPYFSLYFKNSSFIMNKSIKGTIDPKPYNIYYGIEGWYVSQ